MLKNVPTSVTRIICFIGTIRRYKISLSHQVRRIDAVGDVFSSFLLETITFLCKASNFSSSFSHPVTNHGDALKDDTSLVGDSRLMTEEAFIILTTHVAHCSSISNIESYNPITTTSSCHLFVSFPHCLLSQLPSLQRSRWHLPLPVRFHRRHAPPALLL